VPAFELARLSWLDAKKAFATARVALVPIGSCEQHGPHMSLDTDTAIAQAFARRLGDEIGELGVLCPPVTYGMSEHHLAFAGTLSLRAPTLLGMIREIVESLTVHGMRKVLFVNGHGGNLDGLRLAAREASRDGPADVAAVMWALLAADLIAKRAARSRYGHACDIETSVAMAIAPHVVFADRIAAPAPTPARPALVEPQGARVDMPTRFEQWTSDGALGDPRLANKALGEEIVALALSRATEFARQFADQESSNTKRAKRERGNA
jgi:creatinine amidohydrolase